MKEKIIELCKKWGADLVGFAPVSRFPEDSAVHKLMPEAKTVIGLGFRVLRGAYRGIEEGSTYYQYTTMGVENMEETVMPMVSVRLSMMLEEEGYSALPQRRHQQIMAEENSTNPEVAFEEVYRNLPQETQRISTKPPSFADLEKSAFTEHCLPMNSAPLSAPAFC